MVARLRSARHPRLALVALAFIAFVGLGMPDGLFGVGWPSLRADFALPLDALGSLLAVGVAGYTTSSFFTGTLLARFGVGRMLALSCLLTGVALLGYTLVPLWWMVVALGVVAGLGAGAIDAGLNTYVAAHFGARLMQWLHASWGLGSTSGPLLMTAGLALWQSWRVGYWIVGGFQLVLALGFFLTLSLWEQPAPVPGGQKRLTDYQTPLGLALRQPAVWVSVALFVLYVGAETALGVWAYTLLTEARGVEPALAGVVTGSYWLMFTIGRVAAGVVAVRTGFDRLVRGGLLGALVGSALLIWHPAPSVNVLAIGLIGLAIAPIFPALMSSTAARVGDQFAAHTIGMQMAATGVGMALIPAGIGVLADRLSLELIPLGLLVVYAVLFGCYLLAMRLAALDQ
ncbi:MFS transporter [Chloroflexus sp.]|uniref:MFS transporter n=1 Tax=Chloroflexus sp. TaxID=1904827 RepID=UPI002ACE6743|nr:MFS transporter [Chloroflexus sp.]